MDGRHIDVKRAVPGTNKIFVGGLPQNTAASELREHFEAFGVVSDAVVMIDPVSGRSRGFGFVCYLPGQEGAAAVASALEQYNNHRIRGKWIEVKSAASPHKLAAKEGWGSLHDGASGSASPGQDGSDSMAAALAECGNHKIHGKWSEVKNTVSPHHLALNDSSSMTLSESPRSLAASTTELLDAPQLTLLTPRTQVTLQHWKKEQMVQDSLADDFGESWKVPPSFPTKIAAVADAQSCAVRRPKDSPTVSVGDLAADPWFGCVHRNDAVRFASCCSVPSLLPMSGASGEAWKVGCGAGFLATSEALQQSLAELFKQESLRLKEVQVTKKLMHGGG